tara:strand:- start:7347 stop:7910 length:564 start_codon:yes stop_codon:yes gene_type:complete
VAKKLQSAETNVPDAIVEKFIREVSGAREALDSANGEYRAALKAAKSAGINQKQLLAAMKDARRDEEQVKLDDRDFARYRALLNMPVHQMELFGGGGDGTPEEPTLVDGEPTDHHLWEATEAGKVAGRTGGDVGANPHEHPGLNAAWARGFKLGMALIAREMAPGAKVASTRRRREPGAGSLVPPQH